MLDIAICTASVFNFVCPAVDHINAQIIFDEMIPKRFKSISNSDHYLPLPAQEMPLPSAPKLPTEIWENILDNLDMQDRMRLRRVCVVFDQIIQRQCQELCLCIRMPIAVVDDLRTVRPYYQDEEDSNERRRKRLNQKNGLLVWKKEHKLLQKLPQLFSRLTVLRLYQYSDSTIYIDIKPLTSLTHLRKFQVNGLFIISNKSKVQLPQVHQFAKLNATNYVANKRQCDIWTSFPCLKSYQGWNDVYLHRKTPKDGLILLSKLHLKDAHIPAIGPIILPNLQKLTISLQYRLASPLFLIPYLGALKNFQKLFFNLSRRLLFSSFIDERLFLANRVPAVEQTKLCTSLYFIVFGLYQVFDFDKIEFRINGFLMTRDFKSSFDDLWQFLSYFPFNREIIDEQKLDRYRADKLRTNELRSYWVRNDIENQVLTHRFYFGGLLTLDMINNVLQAASRVYFVEFNLHNPAPDTEQPDNQVNLQFLAQLPCMERLHIQNLPNHLIDELPDIISSKLPFLNYVCLEPSFSLQVTFETICRLFDAFLIKAKRNPQIKFKFYDKLYRKELLKIKKAKNIQNVLLFGI